MNAPDSRTRSKITLNPSKVVTTSIPFELLVRLIVSNVLLVFVLDAGKEWLLATNVGVFWVLMRVLACGGLGVIVWEGVTGTLGKKHSIEWSVLGTSSLLLFVQQACLMTALYRMSAIRVVLFSNFSVFWMGAIVNRQSVPHSLALFMAFMLALLTDGGFDKLGIKAAFPGYGAILLHGVATAGLDHTQRVLGPSLGWNAATLASTLGATVIALPFYVFKTFVFEYHGGPAVPLFSLLIIPFLAYILLVLTPSARSAITAEALPQQHFLYSYLSSFIASVIFGPLAFSQFPSWSDLIIGATLFYGMNPDKSETLGAPPRTPSSRLLKAYLKTILSNPESRKIFYFLVLNLSYMMIQMLYGIWTNSLGLISDAIHMAFDCMAIGMGLFASVMATWPPNERFTYGYGRIETLSGFANGIFLILISIFIVFEAIQRILDPPEMNTNQLLLVSTVGLGVNLFGMFAMGGHHHHGHSHSHGHSHEDHTHSHDSPVSPLGSHSGGHSHSHSHSPERYHSHSPTNGSLNRRSSSPQGSDDEHQKHKHVHFRSPSHSPITPRATGQRTISHSHTISHIPSSIASQKSLSVPRPNHAHGQPHHHQRAVSLQIPSPSSPFSADETDISSPGFLTPPSSDTSLTSPLTPGYVFGHDDHFAQHHHSAHVPNLHDHSHGHGHDHHEGHSHNMRGVFLHVMADTLGSVGVIISTLLIQYYGWTGFDPIASLFIAVLIAASVIPLVIDSGKVLCLDIGSKEESVKQALQELPSIEGLASYAAPRFWPKDDSSLIGSIRIQIAHSPSASDPSGPHSTTRMGYYSIDKVVERVDSLLRARISGLEELTIQVEAAQATG